MLIFLAIVLGPGCGFMLYALRQFWLEARRFRRADPRRLNVTIVRATDISTRSSGERIPRQSSETPKVRAVLIKEAGPAKFAASAEEPTRGKVVTTFLKNRLAALPSGTGRLAVKHVAKGSS
jgi:hypothetical protein